MPAYALLALSAACATPRQATPRDVADANDTGHLLSARSEDERKVLVEAAHLGTGVAQRLGNISVVAGAPYLAASGRTCRQLRLDGSGRPAVRLACNDGQAWFFVPDVFGATDSPPE